MNIPEKDVLFSQAVKAGRRIYYFDVKESRNGDKFVAITESKRVTDGSAEKAPSFQKHKLFLYKEDFEKFQYALANVVGVAQGKLSPADFSEEDNVMFLNQEE